ncbi:tol-pal system protein YbgF [Jannaschia pagri]|uniref:Cell division coordinator CpoB n=1 Tax=Jannaschia pagri TaxID=2829797 RepID=A0ABQ4NHY1_9RHOB|nr:MULTISPECIES: tol-pal system protein YbgF [unclassified Jannaschia]GIT89877.1 tol-pal system protein YbgF [Jannaschia sp. AI_61]GIT94016.1 tol-pal system protein YbgF [Jannaschia sp. AI_62]
MRLALLLALALATSAAAQDQTETLADIRQKLSALNTEMQALTRELSTTGAAGLGIQGTSFPERVISMEQQLQQLTAQTERLSFRVETVARDGGNRIEDLRFQLCELTPDCDLGALPDPGPLGETAPESPASAPTAGAPIRPTARPDRSVPGPELAVGEQADFNAAKALFDGGQMAEAAQSFERFVTNYPTGPLSTEAQFLRGEALARQGQHANAARAYLEAFSGTPEGPRAPNALLGLGQSLGSLGQTDEACLTLAEIAVRFPSSPTVAQANSAQAGLGCR